MSASKFYTPAACRRKANQHWEMAGLARLDDDPTDAERHTKLARQWELRAASGGWEEQRKENRRA